MSDDFIRKLNKGKPKTLKEFADIWHGFDTQKLDTKAIETTNIINPDTE